ncbi:MAG: type I-C CRISPR-associated protein Cas5 [Lachnospiraceae bacterium]|nr:type I-C CRISPR-associated protein Cas5 [Lachnospiraceae bacterium]
MSFGFKIIVEGRYACFTRPELKVERVSYDVPTPGAIEGMLKSIYWKPAIRYEVDKIVVFNPIKFKSVRRNEVSSKISFSNVKKQMKDDSVDISLYTKDDRSQRSSMVLADVKYGIEFHFELTGLRCEGEENSEDKHYNIIKRRIENGQCFRTPCLGCSEFVVEKLSMVDKFDLSLISKEIIDSGDVDLGFMSYKVKFDDSDKLTDKNWEEHQFSDKAKTIFFRPHMIEGIIDVKKYKENIVC